MQAARPCKGTGDTAQSLPSTDKLSGLGRAAGRQPPSQQLTGLGRRHDVGFRCAVRCMVLLGLCWCLQNYLQAMACAANYAWVNRSSMTFLARQAFAKQFSSTPDDLDMAVVYDVSHNIAKVCVQVISWHWTAAACTVVWCCPVQLSTQLTVPARAARMGLNTFHASRHLARSRLVVCLSLHPL